MKNLAASTQARINLGHFGGGMPSKHLLAFRYDHAQAKDAVYKDLDTKTLQEELLSIGLIAREVHSKAVSRVEYLKRPDYGRKLNDESINSLLEHPIYNEITIIIADGLSANAINSHAVLFLKSLIPLLNEFMSKEIIIVHQGRVAISDEIGELCNSKISIILIGERPGLSTPDSMGIYLTYNPKVGNTDEKRNCISNIHSHGLPYDFAAQKLNYLIRESIHLKLSGVNLKEL